MKYDFNKSTYNNHQESVKWKNIHNKIPMGIADMDFETVPEIKEAIIERASRDIFGYSELQADYHQSIIDWYAKRHNWDIKEDWLCISPGVSPAIGICIRAFAHPGDKVLLQSPVYHPFFGEITHNGCEVVNNPLKLGDKGFEIDFEDLEIKASDLRVKLMILCNPHNPVGRVWTREELVRIGEICLRNDVLVIADEIHGDLVFTGHIYIPFASISEEFAHGSITCTAPSKTFNLAGLQVSNIVIPDEGLRREYEIGRINIGISRLNVFASTACTTAYQHGEEWLEELLAYLQDNRDYAIDFIKKEIPILEVSPPEGTYMLWLDFRKLGLDDEELKVLIIDKAGVLLNEGHTFGPGGEGFLRLNFACTRSLLQEGLERIKKAVNGSIRGEAVE